MRTRRAVRVEAASMPGSGRAHDVIENDGPVVAFILAFALVAIGLRRSGYIHFLAFRLSEKGGERTATLPQRPLTGPAGHGARRAAPATSSWARAPAPAGIGGAHWPACPMQRGGRRPTGR